MSLHKTVALISLVLPMLACSSGDDGGVPNTNTGGDWVVTTGVTASALGGIYTKLSSCVVANIDSDSATPESMDVAWEFVDGYPSNVSSGRYIHRYYINSDCDPAFMVFSDEVVVEYTESSASLDYQRIDFTVTDTVRAVATQSPVASQAATILNGIQSCGLTTWDVNPSLSNASSVCINTFSHNSSGAVVYATQSRWQGVYQLLSAGLGLHWGVEGERPDGGLTYSANYAQ